MSEQDILAAISALRDGLVKRQDEQGAKLDALALSLRGLTEREAISAWSALTKAKFEQLTQMLGSEACERNKNWNNVMEKLAGLGEELGITASAKNPTALSLNERLAGLESKLEQIGQVAQDTSMIRALVSLGGLAAAPKQKQRKGYTEVPNSALKWLFGEEGRFEDPNPPGKYKRPYWWRTEFRKMIEAGQRKGRRK